MNKCQNLSGIVRTPEPNTNPIQAVRCILTSSSTFIQFVKSILVRLYTKILLEKKYNVMDWRQIYFHHCNGLLLFHHSEILLYTNTSSLSMSSTI